MVETSERFVLMGLLQRNVKSSRLEVLCKKGILKMFVKLTGKHLLQRDFATVTSILKSTQRSTFWNKSSWKT